jgi:hypothetical protein
MTTTHTTHQDIPFPPDPNPRKPRLAVPPGSWHFHVFGPPHRFPYAESRRYSPPTAPIEHWLSVSSAIGIERGFVVTPSVHDLDPAAERYRGRISGSLLDRIDLHVNVARVPFDELSTLQRAEPSAAIRTRVNRTVNADLRGGDLRIYAALDPASSALLEGITRRERSRCKKHRHARSLVPRQAGRFIVLTSTA